MNAVVLRGDAAHLPLPDASVDLIVTSPPYFGLRSYADGGEHYAGQIGSEETWQEYLAALLKCTREWVRVLKPEGSIFVNLGDKYANDAKWGGATSGKHVAGLHGKTAIGRAKLSTGIPPKSLMLLPERYRIGCVDQIGLTARAVIEWSKPNGMPESVQDRCRRSHEDVIHLVRQQRYYAAVDEIREPHVKQDFGNRSSYAPGSSSGYVNGKRPAKGDAGLPLNPLGRLPGSVWEIQSQPLIVPPHLGVDHFAAYPTELPRRIILGWSPPGICLECGEGRRPVTRIEHERGWIRATAGGRHRSGDGNPGERVGQAVNNRQLATIVGYACACTPFADQIEDWIPPPTRPAVVLDPFGGTGTTALVADMHGRTGITIDRSADYCRLAGWRTRDPGERARALGVPKPPRVPEGQASLFDEAS